MGVRYTNLIMQLLDLAPYTLRPVKGASADVDIRIHLANRLPRPSLKVEDNALHYAPTRQQSPDCFQDCLVVGRPSSRHEAEQSRYLLDAGARSDEDMQRVELHERLRDDVKCSIRIPCLRSRQQLEHAGTGKNQMSAVILRYVGLQKVDRNKAHIDGEI